jgi:hypothetical protein
VLFFRFPDSTFAIWFRHLQARFIGQMIYCLARGHSRQVQRDLFPYYAGHGHRSYLSVKARLLRCIALRQCLRQQEI